MKKAIILAAFGTSSQTKVTYDQLTDYVSQKFPSTDIFMGYTAKSFSNNDTQIIHPKIILERLLLQGYKQIVIQSLHLMPGHDFHKLRCDITYSPQVSLGMPLLFCEKDFYRVPKALGSHHTSSQDTANLVLGHGTDHPTWAFYPALLQYLRNAWGENVYVGVVEKSPDSNELPKQIAQAGFTKVKLIPFFLNTGFHFRRDITGDKPDSWNNRLIEAGLSVEIIPTGIGINPFIQEIFCDHIKDAFKMLGR